ncbi:FG-GAP-like repeat-containing protein [Sporichthya polymorpha]|uniref:FG-GAP-like repeat-containing protein n=1 Tax=Sporichthya polymorpha TaxID=35751 RepID=UPI00037BEDDC|nr:FG-GAP-like repeat-containing protein [Sporichthya polymorpha]
MRYSSDRCPTPSAAWLTAALLSGGLVLAAGGPAGGAAGPVTAPAACRGAAGDTLAGDLNGDGFGDIVVTEYGRTRLQGGIHVYYGTANGLTAEPAGTAPDDEFLTQDSPGVPDKSEDSDEWGAALAVADFNGDRCADVAVGAPGENGTTGAVTILYGSPTGLITATGRPRPLHLSQNTPGVPDAAEPNDRFGAALAAGDFDGDGLADLAVGAPGETKGKAFGSGYVTVLFGASGGLNAGRKAADLRPGRGVVGGKAEDSDAFGTALAAGDVTGDGIDELIVGIPGEDGRGAVALLRGTRDGFTAPAAAFDRGTAGVGKPTFGDAFGSALTTGDFNGDGRTDVAIGMPGADRSRGAVAVLHAAAGGLSAPQLWRQGDDRVSGAAQDGDRFGAVLAAGRLAEGRYDGLAIGTPGDSVEAPGGTVANAGSVTVLLGSAQGLRAKGALLVSQATPGVGGDPTTGDRFGAALLVRKLGSGPARLVIGSPAEGAAGTPNHRAGAFTVLGARATGPTGTGSEFWDLARPGTAGDPARGVFLGYALG